MKKIIVLLLLFAGFVAVFPSQASWLKNKIGWLFEAGQIPYTIVGIFIIFIAIGVVCFRAKVNAR